MSPKRALAEEQKKSTYRAIEAKKCQGCGTPHNLSRSHTFSQRRLEFIADPRNIYVLCMDRCHPAVESNRFWLLDCGEELTKNMFAMDHMAAVGRIAKMADRLEEDGVDSGNLPSWVWERLEILT